MEIPHGPLAFQIAAVELKLQLGIPPGAEFVDGLSLHAVEIRPSKYRGCGARQREASGSPGRPRPASRPAGVSKLSATVRSARASMAVRRQRRRISGSACRDRFRQALVAAPDVVLLIRHAEDGEAFGRRLVGEQVEKIERGLLGGLGAVLDVVGDIEQTPERRGVAARHARLDPVVDAHDDRARSPRACICSTRSDSPRHSDPSSPLRAPARNRRRLARRYSGGSGTSRCRSSLAAGRPGDRRRRGRNERRGRRIVVWPEFDQLAAEFADLAVGPIAAAVAVHAPADAWARLHRRWRRGPCP